MLVKNDNESAHGAVGLKSRDAAGIPETLPRLQGKHVLVLLDDLRRDITVVRQVGVCQIRGENDMGRVSRRYPERVDTLILYRALLKALKDGEADRLLKIAEFAGMKFTEEETPASTMTPDTELMLSTLFASGLRAGTH